MFGFNDMTGVRIDTSCKDKFTEEKKELFDIYTNICIAITDENVSLFDIHVLGTILTISDKYNNSIIRNISYK